MNDRLASILADVFGLRKSDVHPDLEKSEVDNWDSLKQMDLVMSLEREYSIVLEIPDIVKLKSVADIVGVLNEKGVNVED